MLRLRMRACLFTIGVIGLVGAARADEPAPLPRPAGPAPAPLIVIDDGYHVATPYNVTVVGRTLPNPAYNRPNFTLPCDNPNQNFAPLVIEQPECIKRIFGGKDCGCGGGCKGYGFKKDGGRSQGNCATCSNTYNFIWGSSRSYFGESSREFFERPPSVDAVRHKWNPLPVLYRTGYQNP